LSTNPLTTQLCHKIDGCASHDGARAKERLPIAKLLVQVYGADPNAQAANGMTALHAAARAGALALCEFLIYDAGASPAVRDLSGQTALSYARAYSGDKATTDLLKRCTPDR
jgi:ankyrin repeat protein